MFIITSFSFGITLNVPNEYSTIWEAIEAADVGDIVFISNGNYDESDENVIQSKNIQIVGESKEWTVITGANYSSDMGFLTISDATVDISNLTIEDMIADEMALMEEQLAEPSKSLGDHEIQVPLSSLMEEITTVNSGSSIQEASNLMIKNNIGYVVVTKGEKLIGIFGERDILLHFFNADLDSWDNLVVDNHM